MTQLLYITLIVIANICVFASGVIIGISILRILEFSKTKTPKNTQELEPAPELYVEQAAPYTSSDDGNPNVVPVDENFDLEKWHPNGIDKA